MVLHAIQEHFGWISQEAVEWTAKKLELQPINVYELVTFYPMFRQQPMGKYQIKVCRTLSCALGGAYELHEHFCEKLGLDAHAHGPQTTKDGKFTVEFVECLASCGTAPVMMVQRRLPRRRQPRKRRMKLWGGANEDVAFSLQPSAFSIEKLAARHGFEP